ncbi:hypothetical protein M0R45_002093 [Rubus argutus]|uniref:Uncharacterized protein n=1 Tax=Rubus argutus TaxID=59490 RepID=A0AAW1VK98_RUBAR
MFPSNPAALLSNSSSPTPANISLPLILSILEPTLRRTSPLIFTITIIARLSPSLLQLLFCKHSPPALPALTTALILLWTTQSHRSSTTICAQLLLSHRILFGHSPITVRRPRIEPNRHRSSQQPSRLGLMETERRK